jgi:hypothetical protein
MKPNKDLFNDIDTKRQTGVKIENEEFMSASGLGSIGVKTKRRKWVICEVMHMPQANQNLLSSRQLIEHGYLLNFEG